MHVRRTGALQGEAWSESGKIYSEDDHVGDYCANTGRPLGSFFVLNIAISNVRVVHTVPD